MAKIINIGMIGAGGITHAIHIPAFQSCPEVRILAVCDNNLELAEKVAKQNRIKYVFKDYRKLLEVKEIDAVVIATPNLFHAPMATEAIEAGKHILLEKPIAMNYPEAKRLYNRAKKRGIINAVAFNYRFVPSLQYFKSLITSGKLGKIYHIRAFYLQQWPRPDIWSWRCDRSLAGTGHLGDLGSHLIDFARFLVGEFKSVTGNLTWMRKTRKDPLTGKIKKSDTDDACQFLAKFRNGATGVFEVTRYAPGRGCRTGYQYVEVNGSEGTVIYEFQSPESGKSTKGLPSPESLKICIGKENIASGKLEVIKVPASFLKVKHSERRLPARDPVWEPRYDLAHIFVHGIRTNVPVSPNFYDGMKAMQVVDAVVASEGREIFL